MRTRGTRASPQRGKVEEAGPYRGRHLAGECLVAPSWVEPECDCHNDVDLPGWEGPWVSACRSAGASKRPAGSAPLAVCTELPGLQGLPRVIETGQTIMRRKPSTADGERAGQQQHADAMREQCARQLERPSWMV